ncbi:MAG: hypothetical protein JWO03_3443 [Bacteroidetes bacterium]|nr:hypothetical protein [Bacteroidota bacterium]
MKKALLVFALFAGVAFSASAQCTPDTTHFTSTKHVYPDSLPCAVYGQSFAGVVSIQIPDSVDAHEFVGIIPAGSLQATIDSVQITGISGYPTGISSVSNPALGPTWLKPGDVSCANFTGTSTANDGRYNLTITGTGCGHFTLPQAAGGGTYDSCIANFPLSRLYPYHLCSTGHPAGISEVLNGVNLGIFPNPNQGAFTVNISADDRIAGDMMVMDALGRTIHTQSLDVTGTKQIALDLGHISSGVYLLVINTANGKAVKQFSVK